MRRTQVGERWHVVITLEGQVRAVNSEAALAIFRARVERGGLNAHVISQKARRWVTMAPSSTGEDA